MKYTFNNIFKRFSVAIIFALLLPLFSGCGGLLGANYREIDTLQLVQTLGIDEDKDIYEITISTGKMGESQPPVIISRPGASLLQGENSVQEYSSKEELFFSHTKYAVFGEEAAKKSIPEFLDHLARGARMRMDSTLFVVKGSTAKNLIVQSGKSDYVITDSLSSVERDVKREGSVYPFNCREILRATCEYGSALACAISPSQTEGSVYSESGSLTATPTGYAILREGSLCGYLDAELSWGASLLMGHSGTGILPLKNGEQKISLSTMPGKTVFSVEWGEDGSLQRINADIEVKGSLLEMSAPPKEEQDAFLKTLSRLFEDEVKLRCDEVLRRSVALESDFLGLLGIIRKQYPAEFAALEGGFVPAMCQAEIVVSVKATVLRSLEREGTQWAVQEESYR